MELGENDDFKNLLLKILLPVHSKNYRTDAAIDTWYYLCVTAGTT